MCRLNELSVGFPYYVWQQTAFLMELRRILWLMGLLQNRRLLVHLRMLMLIKSRLGRCFITRNTSTGLSFLNLNFSAFQINVLLGRHSVHTRFIVERQESKASRFPIPLIVHDSNFHDVTVTAEDLPQIGFGNARWKSAEKNFRVDTGSCRLSRHLSGFAEFRVNRSKVERILRDKWNLVNRLILQYKTVAIQNVDEVFFYLCFILFLSLSLYLDNTELTVRRDDAAHFAAPVQHCSHPGTSQIQSPWNVPFRCSSPQHNRRLRQNVGSNALGFLGMFPRTSRRQTACYLNIQVIVTVTLQVQTSSV